MSGPLKEHTTTVELDSPSDRPHLQLVQRIPSRLTEGKDELNFAEFPLSSLSERPDPNVKTIVFQDRIFDRSRNEHLTRQVTITGSDAYGLPTPVDEEVLLALIQLSKLQGFQSKRVYFTRYQLLQLLKWPPTGQSYTRLESSLKRWIGVTIYYKNAWRDRKAHCWADESFHMLENLKIVDSQARSSRATEDSDAALSYFEWNEVVFRSFQNGNVKALNYDLFLSIERSIAKRLYRFLDKRFYHAAELEFDMKTLAYEHVGMSRRTPTGDLKRKLGAAIDELEEKGFLQPTSKEQRFVKEGPGSWRIVFVKRNAAGSSRNDASHIQGTDGLVAALAQFGVREQKARELVDRFPREDIQQKLEIAKWLKGKGDSRISSNAAGYLVSSIEDSYEPPREFKHEIDDKNRKIKQRVVAASNERQRQVKLEREDAREAARRNAIDGFLDAISEDERILLEAEALGHAEPKKLKMVQLGGKVGEAARRTIVDNHILELLANGMGDSTRKHSAPH